MLEFPITVKLTGVIFGNAQRNINTFGCDDIHWFCLVREPDNEFDSKAIRVEIADFFMGYVPREIAEELAPLMDSGSVYDAEFVGINRHPRKPTVGITVRIIPAEPSYSQSKGAI